MRTAANPFKATFGTTPPLLVGGDDVIRVFVLPSTTVQEPTNVLLWWLELRGIDKTVLPNAFEDVAVQSEPKTVTGLNLTIFTLGIGLEWTDHDPRAHSFYTLR
ncbi:hypothetical protein [Corynebacterium kozikiae]|uniref:hypothetical protein n=1 Tax=Corynebacterium kozikiae TaxID=2968469 RepID=UPI00211CA55F|nr:hypothetical protein [Corynebacterium sp. 76QC2CO]MCQ9343259.1 hypothetical protein [Corynebacterium sp. 76QC2CO]